MNEAPKLAAKSAYDGLDRAGLLNELADRDGLADMGAVVGPVAHEFNNFLNALMLQLAVLEMAASDQLKCELQGLKLQSKRMAAIIRQLQQYGRRREGDTAPACLNRAATAAVEQIERDPVRTGNPRVQRGANPETGTVPLRLILGDGLPLIPGPAADVRRLCRFLLNAVAWTVADGGSLILTTSKTAQGACVRLEAFGALQISLAQLLDKPVESECVHNLELAACHCLVRRLGGSIRAEPLSGGESLVLELPAVGN